MRQLRLQPGERPRRHGRRGQGVARERRRQGVLPWRRRGQAQVVPRRQALQAPQALAGVIGDSRIYLHQPAWSESRAGMTAEVENLFLYHMRRFDRRLDTIAADMQDIKIRMTAVEQNLSLVNQGLALVNHRIERVEERLARIERRLDLVESCFPHTIKTSS